MPSDTETLLSMGFDPARVECTRHWGVHLLYSDLCAPGAVKATGGRGLQPAMDHLLENEGNPVPDLGSVTNSASTAQPMDEDEDEDAETLRALTGQRGASGSSGADQEAKVQLRLRMGGWTTGS